MTHTYICPAPVHYWSPDLATTVRHVHAYKAHCSCGWTGKGWKTHREAQLERSFHVCEPHT